MAEIKRVPLQNADIGSHSKKKNEKSEEKAKQITPSFRFVLNLTESNEEKCPEFNYSQLLKNAEKKLKKDKKKDENTITNGGSLLDDSEEKILDIARYYEAKYGNRKKIDNVDLGAGYDESDSFIDNTNAYDEFVPEELTTAHGGFYVNSGPLEYKDSDNPKFVQQNNVGHGNENGNNDEEESSDNDSEEEEQEESKSSKRSKRCISSSDNDEATEIPHPPKAKPRLEEAECSIVD